jgi:hypothetical protein
MGRAYPIAASGQVRTITSGSDRMEEATSPCAGSMCAWETPGQLAHPAWKSSTASCSRYFMDLDRLVGLSTGVPSVSGQPTQVSTEFQRRFRRADLGANQDRGRTQLPWGKDTTRALSESASERRPGCPKANRVCTARTSHPIPRNSVSTCSTCIRRSSQSRNGGIATPYPRRRCSYDQRLTTNSCRH